MDAPDGLGYISGNDRRGTDMRRMTGRAILAIALLWLAACSDPLGDMERLGQVELAEGASAATIAPTAMDQADAPGLLTQAMAGDLSEGPDVLPAAMATSAAPALRGGLFGRFGSGGSAAPRTGPDAAEIVFGTTLPAGQIATVCGVSPATLGTPVGTSSGYTVYDSAPGSTALRTHYVTGFGDGCVRQVTAALALFGDVGTHEGLRYSAGTAGLPYSTTDTAYEQLKARFCRVAAGTPCGARIDRLAERTAFLSLYSTFGTATEWDDILFSDGAVIAMDTKGN